jgi:hypothetical protein
MEVIRRVWLPERDPHATLDMHSAKLIPVLGRIQDFA